MKRNLAPVVLFVFNRPWHTRQTLEALKLNELAEESVLYIFSDGPKQDQNRNELKKIEEVRKLIREEKWCGEVKIVERNKNLGLADSVISGVTEIINVHGRVIVLEDDIITGKYFLTFINNGLEIYESEKRVFGISGFQFSPLKSIKDETYFLPIMSSLGYGTWKDRWNLINFNEKELLNQIYLKRLTKKLDFGNLKYYQMLKNQISGKSDSWAIRFYISMFLANGVFLFPKFSLIKNIGFDGTGVHSGKSVPNHFRSKINLAENILIKKQKVFIDKSIEENIKEGTYKVGKANNNGIKGFIKHLIPTKFIQFTQRKIYKKGEPHNKKYPIDRFTPTIVNIQGKNIGVPDITSFNFMYNEIFKLEIYKFYTGKKEPYIIDGGANIGLASIYFKILFPNAKIIAFEPDPDIFKILEENIKIFNFTNVEMIKKGLWNEDKRTTFKSEGADAGLIAEIDPGNPGIGKEIEVTSLQKFLKIPVDFLKLDIEGSETIVLKDIRNDLKMVERIFIEYHSFVGQKQTLVEIIKILKENNFRIYISSPGIKSTSPFVKLNVYNNMDMQLNIYGFKEN